MDQMRILLAGYTSMPYIGGVATYIEILRRELQRLGHQVDILVHKPGMRQYYMPTNGRHLDKALVKTPIRAYLSALYARHRLPVHPVAKKYEVERYCFEMAAAYFGLEAYDVIHAQDLISARALWRIKPAHVPLVVTLHSYWDNRPSYISFFKSCGAASSDRTIVPSNWLKEKLVHHHQVPEHHLEVIPNGINPARFFPVPPRHKLPSEPTIFICTARLSAEKGHFYLLEALAKLMRVRSDWQCWLVGNGPLRKKLRLQCLRLGLQNHVVFMGNRNDVPQLLQRADIFVMASVKDIFPYAVLEAQMAGKPVVVTNAGGISEMVHHGVTGLLSPAGQSEEMYENMKLLLENEHLRQSIAENGRKLALEKWSVDSKVKRVLDVYKKVIQKDQR